MPLIDIPFQCFEANIFEPKPGIFGSDIGGQFMFYYVPKPGIFGWDIGGPFIFYDVNHC